MRKSREASKDLPGFWLLAQYGHYKPGGEGARSKEWEHQLKQGIVEALTQTRRVTRTRIKEDSERNQRPNLENAEISLQQKGQAGLNKLKVETEW